MKYKVVSFRHYLHTAGNNVTEGYLNEGPCFHVQREDGYVIAIFFSEANANEYCKITLLKQHHERMQSGFIYSHRKADGSIEWAWEETGF